MTKFKVGDKVRRQKQFQRDSFWCGAIPENMWDSVFTVSAVRNSSIIHLAETPDEEYSFDANMFELVEFAIKLHNGREYTLVAKDTPDVGTNIGYYNDTKEVFSFHDIDWTKIPVDTKILVSDDKVVWHKRHFAKYENEAVYAWTNGITSWTSKAVALDQTTWEYAKLA